jgi:CPA2 family monovalent cation:H+ antiporter-2
LNHIGPALFEVLLLLSLALVLGALAERLRQSAVVGYLLAGMALGPFRDVIVPEGDPIHAVAELGVALLLFTIGLELSWSELLRLGRRPLIAGSTQILGTIAVVAALGAAFGLALAAAVALGAVVCVSSTACTMRELIVRGEFDAQHGRLAVGVLLLQDVAIVPLTLLISVLARGGGGEAGILYPLFRDVVVCALFLGALLVVGNHLLPRLLSLESMRGNRELPILFAIAVALAASIGALQLGISPALGAFVAGIGLGGSPFATQVRADVGPLRTLFLTLFFGSVGMLADLQWIFAHLPLVGAAVVAGVVIKLATAWLGGVLAGAGHRHAFAAGACLANIGEFSFVLAGLAYLGAAGSRGSADGHGPADEASASTALFSDDVYQLVVAVTIATLLATPYLVRSAPRLGERVRDLINRAPGEAGAAGTQRQASAAGERQTPDVLVVGYGPAGRAVALAERGRGHRVVVLDLNRTLVEKARQDGLEAHVGDAALADVLEHHHAGGWDAAVITLPDHRAVRRVIRGLRGLQPELPVAARARYSRYAASLRREGAEPVVDEEEMVGLRLADAVRDAFEHNRPDRKTPAPSGASSAASPNADGEAEAGGESDLDSDRRADGPR